MSRSVIDTKNMTLVEALRQPPRRLALLTQRALLRKAAARIEQLEGFIRALRVDVPLEEHADGGQ